MLVIKDLHLHLEVCGQNASYISKKTTENQLLNCIQEYIQEQIIDEIKSQAIGAKFNIQADEVTDVRNIEQLTLRLRYVKNGKPAERHIEYIMSESITGAALCEDIQQTLIKLELNLQNSVSQTYDGADKFSGQMKGCASLFEKTVLHAQYFHSSDHDLKLALCHTCHGIPEVRNMLTCLLV